MMSSCGKSVQILDRGKLNHYDGPDISNAIVMYDGLRFFGSVEFHTQTQHWYQHKHHKDPNYNGVVLHVVSSSKSVKPVSTENLSQVPTVILANVSKGKEINQLPCSSTISRIHPDIVHLEIERSKSAYFVQLLERVAQWQFGLGLYEQFTASLICSVFDVLGIPANRDWMHYQAKIFLMEHDFKNISLSPNPPSINKKNRFANSPTERLHQARIIAENILSITKKDWLHLDIEHLFSATLRATPHLSHRISAIMWAVAFLPSVYLFANNIHSLAMMSVIYDFWKTSEVPLPAHFVSLLKQSNWPKMFHFDDPGLIFKIKNDCLNKRCEQCEILRTSLSA